MSKKYDKYVYIYIYIYIYIKLIIVLYYIIHILYLYIIIKKRKIINVYIYIQLTIIIRSYKLFPSNNRVPIDLFLSMEIFVLFFVEYIGNGWNLLAMVCCLDSLLIPYIGFISENDLIEFCSRAFLIVSHLSCDD